ncbi:MAG: SDR family NAD(P)-dependent oxidoreductase [Bryobacteraceae bacterium]
MLGEYRDKVVLITGGLGFIGSNLAMRLVEEGASVTVVDSSIAGCGANPYNLAAVRDRVNVIPLDIADASDFASEIRKANVIFNLAGEISHIHSMQFPERDLQINAVSQLRFLQECVRHAPGVRVVYAGTRQVYGVPEYLPVDESHPVNPVDFNGIHKFAATMYHMMLSRAGKLDAVVLRLTNVYGPRMALDIACQGFLGTFLRRALLGEALDIFGDGRQVRDPLYVDDVVEAFLLAGLAVLPSRTYNLGGLEPLSLSEIAETMSREAGGVPLTYRPFSAERASIDIGSYCSDWQRIHRELGWKPATSFRDGIARTFSYYRSELAHYLDPGNPDAVCRLPEHHGARHRLALIAV